jgi:hypothetical protein
MKDAERARGLLQHDKLPAVGRQALFTSRCVLKVPYEHIQTTVVL